MRERGGRREKRKRERERENMVSSHRWNIRNRPGHCLERTATSFHRILQAAAAIAKRPFFQPQYANPRFMSFFFLKKKKMRVHNLLCPGQMMGSNEEENQVYI
uniref:Uncharacterized protein n=1 Tax=Micrurus spixii TaxID=129469 RepID=A0A2D4LPI4_9SAUR